MLEKGGQFFQQAAQAQPFGAQDQSVRQANGM